MEKSKQKIRLKIRHFQIDELPRTLGFKWRKQIIHNLKYAVHSIRQRIRILFFKFLTIWFGKIRKKKIWNSLSDPVKSLSNLLLQRNVVPWKLWVAVGGLLAIDLILLVTWSIVDPLRRQVHNFAKIESDDPEDDIEIQPQLEHCKSTHHTVWLGKIRTVYHKLGCSPSHGFTNSQSWILNFDDFDNHILLTKTNKIVLKIRKKIKIHEYKLSVYF